MRINGPLVFNGLARRHLIRVFHLTRIQSWKMLWAGPHKYSLLLRCANCCSCCFVYFTPTSSHSSPPHLFIFFTKKPLHLKHFKRLLVSLHTQATPKRNKDGHQTKSQCLLVDGKLAATCIANLDCVNWLFGKRNIARYFPTNIATVPMLKLLRLRLSTTIK